MTGTLFSSDVRAGASPVEAATAAAEREFAVPAKLLLALSYVVSRWDAHDGIASFDKGYGVMNLQDSPVNDNLRQAAARLSLGSAQVASDLGQNVRGAAVLLRDWYRETYPEDPGLAQASDLARWYLPTTRYLRTDYAGAQRAFGDAIFGAISSGASRTAGGQVTRLSPTAGIAPQRGALEAVPNDKMRADAWRRGQSYRPTESSARGSASFMRSSYQQGADSWLYTENYSAGRYRAIYPYDAVPLIGVVVHTCEAGSVSCQNTIVNSRTPRKSAHWLVYSANGWREQFVHREDTSFHCGECPSATYGNWNPVSVGIEHEGYSSDPFTWYTSWMYARSAWLTAYTCVLYNFGCDRSHVVGHNEVQTGNSDPGSGWDWGWYMYCVGLRVNYLRYGTEFSDCFG